MSYAQAQGTSQAWQPATQPHPLSRFYGGAEYLLWQVKGAPLSVPLVATGPIATTHHGYLNNSDAVILYGAPFAPAVGGNDTQEFPWFSGARVTLGYWLDDAHRFAIEGRGFALERKSAGYSARCDASGNPVLSVPNYNTIPYTPGGRPGGGPPAEDGLPPCLPDDPARADGNVGVITGGVKITNSLQLWGADATGVVTFYRSPSWEFSLLGGARYLNLSESFDLFWDSTGLTGFYAGMYGETRDQFQTRNAFYGASVGLRGRYLQGPWSVELTGRMALGVSHQQVSVSGGFFSYNFTAPFASGPEGIFAQPSIQGTRTATEFAFVPEAQVKLGYAITPWMRLTVGYEGLYFSNVVRPTDQINRNFPKGQTFQQGSVPGAPSTTSPTALFNRTDFWAHGLSVGLTAALNGPALVPQADIAPPPPAVSWAGFYLGGHVGGNWHHYDGTLSGSSVPGFTNPSGAPDVFGFGTSHQGSLAGGGQIGFNWQTGAWVYGIEADVARAGATPVVNGPGSAAFATNTAFEFQNEWQGSVRGRVGFAFDRWLAYATGGVAWNSTNVTGIYGAGSFFGGLTTPAALASARRTLLGGTAGIGVEYALTENVSLAGEYRYTAFERKSFTLGSIPFPFGQASQVTASLEKSSSEITARLNYRFR